ncbi:MAG: hypothetical protein ACOYL5_17230 [Phototrophicaceae bacterium]
MAKKVFNIAESKETKVDGRELEAEIYGDDTGAMTAIKGLTRQRAAQMGIVPLGDGTYKFGKFKLESTGLVISDDVLFDEWETLGKAILGLQQGLQWIIGDWINYGVERTWGETYEQLSKELGLETRTLYNFAGVARRVQFDLRRSNLTFSHHSLVSAKEPEEQAYWLGLAEQNQWSVKQMRLSMTGVKDTPDANEWWKSTFSRLDKVKEQANKLDPETRRELASKLRELILALEEEDYL